MTRVAARLPLVALCACLAAGASPRECRPVRPATPPPRPSSAASPVSVRQTPDGIGVLLQKMEQAVRSGDAAAYAELLAPATAGVAPARFTESVIGPGITRAVVRERDRAPLAGVPSGAGYRLAVDVFCEFGRRARLSTWQVDVVRKISAAGDATTGEWAIRTCDAISSFAALHNLALGPRQYAAKNLVVTADDLELRLPDGAVFTADTDEGPTVLVLIGAGQMVFRPTPQTEREQVRIFARSESIDTGFTAAFVRVSPAALQGHIGRGTMIERRVNPQDARMAAEVFHADNGKSFGVNLGDLTSENWSLVPGTADFLAEVHTKRFGVLTYTRSAHEAEDISLFDRAGRRNISLYASPQKLAQRGFFFDDDDDQDYAVLHYDVEASIEPLRQAISAIGRLTVRVRAQSLTTLTLKLADPLAVDSVMSREFGRVIAMRVVNQNGILLNLPRSVPKGSTLVFTVAYHGRLAPQFIDREATSVAAGQQQYEQPAEATPVEPSYLYSNRSYWYPQAGTNAFATATIRVKVPAGYACVASGDPDTATADLMARPSMSGSEFVFRALQPVRYLSVLVTRLLPVRSQVVPGGGAGASDRDTVMRSAAFYPNVDLRAFASPRMRSRAAPLADRAGDIVRFYASLIGDCPYPTLTLALVERELPGGHSPAYLAVVSQPVQESPYEWRSDPTSFPKFPEFFLAHEIAHQWWGQAVGWKNYHEQWLSEGLAQYFAALYAERLRGKDVFDGIVKRMQDWAVKKSAEGPVYLGYRIGHVKRDPQLFRAIVYNKSATVLHMLRRLVGDDAFFRGLRRFYQEWRFRKAGSDDLRLALEAEAHRPLTRFFERWIYDSRLPKLKFSSRIERDATAGRSVVVLRFEQSGDLFDVPVTVTLEYADRPSADVLVPVTEAVTEMRVPLEGRLRRVEVNRDQAAVAKIER